MIKSVISLMKKRKWYFFLAVLGFCMLEMFTSILLPFCIKGITNGVVQYNIRKVIVSVSGYAGVFLMWWIISPFCQILLDRNCYKTMREFKCNMNEHLVKLPLAYYDSTPTGEIISKMTNDASCLESMIQDNLQNVIRKILGGIAGLCVMAIMDYRFALIVLALGCFSIYTTKYFTECMEEKSNSLLEQRGNTTSDFVEMIKACKSIRLLGCQKQKQEMVAEAADKEKKIQIENGNINAKMNSVILGIDIVTYLLLLFIGCLFVYFSWSDWGSIIALISMKNNTDMLFTEFPIEYGAYKNSMAGVKRLFVLYDMKEEEVISREYLSEEEGKHLALKIQNVSFSYDGTVEILQNFNMEVEKNKLTLLEGESGKGKSTIIKLILGLYEVSDGQILFDRHSADVSYVPQDAQLYRDTIYENISCGDENATMKDVIWAAKLAGVDEFVEGLEAGYDTVLNDDGDKLSGGQKQRISLARALVKKSNILLLDEVTSALDEKNKEKLLETIEHLKEHCSIIFVTHDKSIERISDEVIYL